LEKEWEPDPDVEKSLDPDSDLRSLDSHHWKQQIVWFARLATVFIKVFTLNAATLTNLPVTVKFVF
jgi:hypothetical protein